MLTWLLGLLLLLESPTLHFSNHPEAIRETGTIMRMTLEPGEHTFFWHHISRLPRTSPISIRAWNPTDEPFHVAFFQSTSTEPKESGTNAAKMLLILKTKEYKRIFELKKEFLPGYTITGTGKIVCKTHIQIRLWIGNDDQKAMPKAKPEARAAQITITPQSPSKIIWGGQMSYGRIEKFTLIAKNDTKQIQNYIVQCQPRGGPSAFVGFIGGEIVIQRRISTKAFRTLQQFSLEPGISKNVNITTTGIGGCFYPMHVFIKKIN